LLCVKAKLSSEDSIKKSRFIGVIVPCHNESEALQQLRLLYGEHGNANHIAFAYRIKTEQGIIYRFHDAGEPSGTAGKPIFQHLEGKQLINALVAVIRYFGGVKLGAGGLTRAYGNAAKHVIEAAQLYPYIELTTISYTLAYQQLQAFEYQLKKLGGLVIKQDFAEQIHLQIQLPGDQVSAFKQLFPDHYA